MADSRFVKKLRDELPGWIERGWIDSDSRDRILQHYAQPASAQTLEKSSLIFALLGVILVGTGVISWLAANWSGMSKLARLLVLFGGLWLSYGAAYSFERRRQSRALPEALLLLGVLLFGANIMLVAQMYHIDAHYPGGVLLWALGGLLVAALLHSQPSLVAALALAILWSGMETFGFDQPLHWPFLLFLAAALLLIYRRDWLPAFHVAMIAFIIWSYFAFQHLAAIARNWPPRSDLYLVQIFLLLYIAIYLLGMLASTTERRASFAPALQRYSALAAFLCLYALTFPRLHELRNRAAESQSLAGWLLAFACAFVLVGVLVVWHRHRTRSQKRQRYLNWGDLLLAVIAALLVISLFADPSYAGIVALGFNLLFFTAVFWLIYAGLHESNRTLINTGFFFFALIVVTRYFDTFWTLLDRSLFFILGGLLLLGGGFYLEKHRRKITAKIAPEGK